MPGCALNLRSPLVAAALLASLTLANSAHSADRLILRNLDILIDRTVTALDEDGLRLDSPQKNGRDRLTWDEVERGVVTLDQARFDALLKELGPPLYRIRQRLKIGDYEALSEPAELLYPRYASRQGPTAYMVCQATMWSRMALNRREAAVEPYLRCYELLRAGSASRDGTLALLTLPAEYGRTQPDLAAAGLYHAAAALDKLKDDRGANAVRYELTANYASTQYAARATSESKAALER